MSDISNLPGSGVYIKSVRSIFLLKFPMVTLAVFVTTWSYPPHG